MVRSPAIPMAAGDGERLAAHIADFEQSFRALEGALAERNASAILVSSAEVERRARTLALCLQSARGSLGQNGSAAVRRAVKTVHAQLREARHLVQTAQASANRGLAALFPQTAAPAASYTHQAKGASAGSQLGGRKLGSA
jgi:hypothetical protein